MKRIALLLALPVILIGVMSAWLYQAEKERIADDYAKEAEAWANVILFSLVDSEVYDEESREFSHLRPGADNAAALIIPARQNLEMIPGLEQQYHETFTLSADEANERLDQLASHPSLKTSRTSSGLPLNILVLRRLFSIEGEDSKKELIRREAKDFLFAHPSELNSRLAHDFGLSDEDQKLLALQVSALPLLEEPAPPPGTARLWHRDRHFVLNHEYGLAIIPRWRLEKEVRLRLADSIQYAPRWFVREKIEPQLFFHDHPLDLSGEHREKVEYVVVGSSPEKLAEETFGAFTIEIDDVANLVRDDIARRLSRLKLILTATTSLTALASAFIFFTVRKQRRLAALQTDFIASVSHELRTPVASVSLLAERLEKEELTTEKTAEYHGFIAREGRRLGVLIENILDFSRIEKGRKLYHFEPADLARVITESVQLLQPRAGEKGLSLTDSLRLPVDFSPVIDALAIRQLLVNLLDNAIKFTPRNGKVRIEAEANDETVSLVVTDTGPGIPAAEREKVFRRFHRLETNTEKTGAGIGLSLVKHIAEAHGGSVRIDDNPGGGTKVLVQIPTSQI